MTTDPQPRHIAEALAELARGRVLEAHAYLDAWSSLARSAVPPHAVRHYLDREPVRTPSSAAVESWGGRTGTLLLVGNRGSGKSHEAVSWLHARHLEGRPGRWLSCASWLRLTFDDQRAVLKLAAESTALVVDDLGAGGSDGSKDAHAKLNGLLLERFEHGAPTLVCLNGSEADVAKWLDPRVMSRLEVTGDIVDVSATNLRAGETDEINHPRCPCGNPGRCGHGTAWRVNHEIVELMGCEYVPRATGELGDGPSMGYWRVGLELVLGASNRRNVQASELLGLSRESVLAVARDKAANDKTPSLQAELERALLKMAAGMSARAGTVDSIAALARAEIGQVKARMRKTGQAFEDALASHEDELRELPLAEMQARARGASARADNLARAKIMSERSSARTVKTGNSWSDDAHPIGGRITMQDKPPEWTQDRAKMKRAGFDVQGRPGGYAVVYREKTKLQGLPSPEEAWGKAAQLAGMGF